MGLSIASIIDQTDGSGAIEVVEQVKTSNHTRRRYSRFLKLGANIATVLTMIATAAGVWVALETSIAAEKLHEAESRLNDSRIQTLSSRAEANKAYLDELRAQWQAKNARIEREGIQEELRRSEALLSQRTAEVNAAENKIHANLAKLKSLEVHRQKILSGLSRRVVASLILNHISLHERTQLQLDELQHRTVLYDPSDSDFVSKSDKRAGTYFFERAFLSNKTNPQQICSITPSRGLSGTLYIGNEHTELDLRKSPLYRAICHAMLLRRKEGEGYMTAGQVMDESNGVPHQSTTLWEGLGSGEKDFTIEFAPGASDGKPYEVSAAEKIWSNIDREADLMIQHFSESHTAAQNFTQQVDAWFVANEKSHRSSAELSSEDMSKIRTSLKLFEDGWNARLKQIHWVAETDILDEHNDNEIGMIYRTRLEGLEEWAILHTVKSYNSELLCRASRYAVEQGYLSVTVLEPSCLMNWHVKNETAPSSAP